ncbi:MAG TPA: ABC transporter ATP-binding protein [Rhabdochlamydiaceae bacterium]|nr:ABC transporter ATP-binding protein [Rhabdochlamydiaceae bacterium]
MSHPVIEIKNLAFQYEKTPILEEVDLSVFKGEFIGIFGPNGGGKTTLLKIIMGFLKPYRGEVLLFGSPPKSQRKRIGYVPQIARFDKQFPISVLELVLMGCVSKTSWWGGVPNLLKTKARETLSLVGLADKEHVPFGTLSGGQAQRALIARAIVNDPELLLLDEPTASIDPDAETLIFQLLTQLKKSMTILMVTHDLQGIINKAGRLLCVNRRIASHLPKEICEHFALGLYHSPLKPK